MNEDNETANYYNKVLKSNLIIVITEGVATEVDYRRLKIFLTISLLSKRLFIKIT